jgi:hypothetical protein
MRALCKQTISDVSAEIPIVGCDARVSHKRHSLQPLLPVVPLVNSPCGQGRQLAALDSGRTVSEKVLLGQPARAEPVQ